MSIFPLANKSSSIGFTTSVAPPLPSNSETTLINRMNFSKQDAKKFIVPWSFKLFSSSNASFTFPNKNSFPGSTIALTPGESKICLNES